ncbi:MAG: alcohol dehydrogenase catalytic domain-containing protein [Planctomycetes bacterium]|nr:alcohol dehydrogenase catalytic domain-containing protein [Planctomycetota bacterium]
MIAVDLTAGRIRVLDTPPPRRPRHHARLRLRLAGLCNTDLELQRGYYGFTGTPGHEFVADVLEADTRSLVGQRVVGEINLACRRCAWCRRGLGRHCPRRTVLGIVKHPGAFAEELVLPEENLHVVPASIPDEAAVFVEPLAAACELLDQVRARRGTRVCVLGDGKLGLLVAQVLVARGLDVLHVGRHRSKLAHSKRAGARTKLAETQTRERFPLVVEATGSARGLARAVELAEPRGTIVMKSTVHGTVALETAPVIVNELTLVGSRCGRFEPALRLLKQHAVDVLPLVSERFTLTDAPAAFRAAARHGVLKVLLAP